VSITLIITFLILYIAVSTGNYETDNGRKSRLTSDAVSQYEKDLKSGKKIDVNNYIVKKKEYKNNVNSLTTFLSEVIESSFKRVMNEMFNEMNKAVKDSK